VLGRSRRAASVAELVPSAHSGPDGWPVGRLLVSGLTIDRRWRGRSRDLRERDEVRQQRVDVAAQLDQWRWLVEALQLGEIGAILPVTR
jgi:hypothetical protein